VWWVAPEQQRWVLQPLVDVGMGDDDIRALLQRLAGATDRHPHTLVSDEPAHVRAAWTHTIDRMLTLPDPDDDPPPDQLPAPRSPHR
jgi:hypothetical protein